MSVKNTTGMTQEQREANCQARLEKFKKLPPAERERLLGDEMNYTLNGGLRGLVHAAKTYADDPEPGRKPHWPAEAVTLFSEAAGWGGWALRAQKSNPWAGPMQLAAAVKCASLVSEATRMVAVGWVGDAKETE